MSAVADWGRSLTYDSKMQTTQETPRSESPSRRDKRRSTPPSGARPPGVDTAPADLEELYDDLFGEPALSPTRAAVFFGVYELAVERLMDAEQAVEAARSEFYRGDHPFDYEINDSAGTVGGPGR